MEKLSINRLLNLGCGQRIHPKWVNLDFNTTVPGVIAHDVTQGIPFPDQSFDVVYHSHFLEHLSQADAQYCLEECHRVLRPHGVLRVVVPDWENVVRLYLTALEKSVEGSSEWATKYEWLILEMLDQLVRTSQGGAMQTYLFQECLLNKQFVIERCGVEIYNLIAYAQKNAYNTSKKARFMTRLRNVTRYPHYLREILLKFLLGKEYNAFQIGRFRTQGEVHQWMYDRYSLSRLLKICGFKKIIRRSAFDSAVLSWNEFHLDTEADGTIYKPNSLYMEATKPK